MKSGNQPEVIKALKRLVIPHRHGVIPVGDTVVVTWQDAILLITDGSAELVEEVPKAKPEIRKAELPTEEVRKAEESV